MERNGSNTLQRQYIYGLKPIRQTVAPASYFHTDQLVLMSGRSNNRRTAHKPSRFPDRFTGLGLVVFLGVLWRRCFFSLPEVRVDEKIPVREKMSSSCDRQLHLQGVAVHPHCPGRDAKRLPDLKVCMAKGDEV